MKQKENKVDECVHCGMCNANCPTFKATGNEHYGPRGRALMILSESIDKSFYDCTLCMACVKECPVNIDLELRKVREELVKKGIETGPNKEMMDNIRKHGNPFGKIEEGKIPDKLYCC